MALTSAPAPAPAAARPVVPPGFSEPRLKVLEYQGRSIILFDLHAIEPREAIQLVEGPFRRFMDAQRPIKECLTLVESRGTRPHAEATTAIRAFAQQNAPYVRASAVVTDSAIHRLAVGTIAMFTKRKIKAFEDERTALDWLAAQ